MKQWKLILVTLLAVLLVCVCTSAMAEDHKCEAGFTDIKSATCVQAATSTYRACVDANCPLGNYAKADVIVGEKNPANHRNQKTQAKVPATCTTEGREAYTYCGDCWVVLSGGETIPAAHKWKETTTKAATCTEAGYKTSICTVTNCTETKTETIPATGHSLKFDHTEAPKCGAEGYDLYKCSKCVYTEKLHKVAATGNHTWNKQELKHVDPTCSEKGSDFFNCTNKGCTATKTEYIDIDPTAHKFSKAVEAKAATCVEDGYTKHWVCAYCGEKDSHYEVVTNPNNHKTKYADKKWETCTEDGYEAHYYCELCDWKGDTYKVRKAPGHNFDKYNGFVKKPTCIEAGSAYYMCVNGNCTEYEIREVAIDPTAHQTKNVAKKWETCLEDGHEAYTYCELCGKKWGGDVIPAPGHSWKNHKTVKAATCTATGIMHQGCEWCDAEQDVVIPMKEHDWFLDSTKSYAATCTTDGLNFFICKTCDEATKEEVLNKTEHVMRLKSTHAADCENYGYELWVCKNGCGYEEERRTVEALGHEWETKNVVKPTCTAEGYTAQKCKTCGAYQNIDKTPMVDHTYVKTKNVHAATCEGQGYTWYKCSVCGDEIKWDFVPATGHNYVLVKNIPASCKAEGVQWFECKKTGCETPSKSEKVAVLPHNYAESKWQIVVAPTCTETGRKMNVCTMCGGEPKYEELPANGHTYGEPIPYTGKAPTCTKDGEGAKYCKDCQHMVTVTIPALNCKNAKTTTVIEATCTSQGMSKTYCPDCKKTTYGLIAAKGHGKMVEVSKTEPTCTKAGEIVTKCEVCGANNIEVVPATGHTHTKEEIVKAPTCTVAGSNQVVCTVCNTVIETKEVPALGHGATKEETAKAATCTEAGSINVVCTVCGDVLDTKEVAALGHGATEEKVVEEATCTEAGSIEVICTVCGDVLETKEVPALDHDMVKGDVTAPTCTEDGFTTYECTRCDYTEDKDVTAATGHVDTKEVETLAPTCTEDGNIDVVCACGEVVDSIVVPALGHDMVAGEVTAPTCLDDGYTTYECSRCDVTEIKDETEALGHDLVLIENAVEATPAAPGEDHNACTRCDYFEIVKYNKYTKYYYENTLTSFGPTTEELLGEGDWYRVTPIDLSVDGIYTFDLIASNAYVVGSVTITVSEGIMTVSYDVNADHIEVLEEALLLFASKADLAEGNAVTVAFGEDINLAELFGEDTKIMVSVMLIGTYDAAGYGVYGFEADAEEIADMLAIID